MSLTHLKEQLNNMSIQAQAIDKQRGESLKPLFDDRLFSCLSRLLSPCVQEAKNVIAQFEEEQKSGRLSSIRAAHLCEKLLNQVAALQREMATLSIREKEKRFAFKHTTSMNQLYQDLAQHQNWERRLEEKLNQIEAFFSYQTTQKNQIEIQKHLIVTKERLSRCNKAKQKIESNIAFILKKRTR